MGASAADQQAEQQQQQQLMDHLYTFENQGFVTIPNVLSATETAALRARIEAPGRLPPLRRDHPTSFFGLNQGQADQEGAGILDWGQELVDLVAHPRLMPLLAATLDASGVGSHPPVAAEHGSAEALLTGVRLDRWCGATPLPPFHPLSRRV